MVGADETAYGVAMHDAEHKDHSGDIIKMKTMTMKHGVQMCTVAVIRRADAADAFFLCNSNLFPSIYAYFYRLYKTFS